MAKFVSPTGSNVIWLSQTTHGENDKKPNDLSQQQAVDISLVNNAPVYSVCDGTVELISTTLGGYVSIIPTGCDWRVLSVHLKDFQVKAGQKVKAGDYLGRISLVEQTHLHLGCKNKNGLAPHPNPMNYFDRGIEFKTTHQSIADIWFNGKNKNGGLNWSLFQDLSYENTNMKKGDRIIVKTAQNIRMSPGGKITGDSIPGQTGIIWDEPRQAMADGKSYTWFDIHFDGAGSGWLADVGKFEIAPVAIPDTPNCDEYIKKVETLQVEIEDLRVEVGGLESELKLADERVTYANKTLKTREAEIDELKANSEAEIKRLQEDLDLKNRTLEETVKELNELKEGRDSILKKIGDIIYKLFKGSSVS